tara:strand:+ start:38 stop:430 length:393 start_codon:yes stop_codon:yes gene_type:complete
MLEDFIYEIPFISAGFPSPAEDFSDFLISLDDEFIKHPAATFMSYVNGDSMVDAGIFHGDILIIDRSLKAKNGNIVVALLNGEFTVKKLLMINGKLSLVSENENYKPINITLEMDFQVWGVVTTSIKRFI